MAEQKKEERLCGNLEALLGTWEGVRGWNLIAVPQHKSRGTQNYRLIINQYREKLTFKKIDDPVENKGGFANQVVGAVHYTQEINDLKTDELIHVETGMWLYLEQMNFHPQARKKYKAPFTIARSGTIPHGNSVLVVGDSSVIQGAPNVPDISSLPQKRELKGAPKNYLEAYDIEQENFDVGFFNVFNPNANIKRDIQGLDIIETIHFSLNSKNGGGFHNVDFIQQHVRPSRFVCDLWLERVQSSSGSIFEQLQYSQIVDLQIAPRFDGVSKLIAFPHIDVNTLRRSN